MSEVKVEETLEFLTQIHTAWDNSEQRAALRTRPRRKVSYDYISTESAQSQYLRSLAYSQQTQLFQIPLWHAAYRLYDQLWAGQSNIDVPVENLWQYRGCSGALVWLNDEYGGTYFPVSQLVDTGVIGLNRQIEMDWTEGAGVIAPVAWGCLSQSGDYTNFTGNCTALNLTVEMLREAEAPILPNSLSEFYYEPDKKFWGTNLSEMYLGFELFMKPPAWAGDMSAKFSRNANRLDNKTGVFKYDLKSNDPTESREMEYIMTSRAEINNMQRFFIRKKGRLHSFYAPTWMQDIEPAKDCNAGDVSIITKYSRYWSYFANTKRRNKAIIFYRDLTAEIITIAGYATDSTGEYGKVILEKPLTRPINNNQVAMISYLCRYRLDHDTMVTDYETVESGTTSFTLTEVTQ